MYGLILVSYYLAQETAKDDGLSYLDACLAGSGAQAAIKAAYFDRKKMSSTNLQLYEGCIALRRDNSNVNRIAHLIPIGYIN